MIKAFEQMVIEAAVTGNKNLAITALTLNPLCDSDSTANIVFKELCDAHKDYLPLFKD